MIKNSVMDKFDLFYRMLGQQVRDFSKEMPNFEVFLVQPSGCTAHLAVAYKDKETYRVIASMNTFVWFDKYVKFAFPEEIYVLQEKIINFLSKVKDFCNILEYYKNENRDKLIKFMNIFPEHGLKSGYIIFMERNGDLFTKGTKDSSTFSGSQVIPLNINSEIFKTHLDNKRFGYHCLITLKKNIDLKISFS